MLETLIAKHAHTLILSAETNYLTKPQMWTQGSCWSPSKHSA